MKIPSMKHRDGTGKYFLFHSLTALFGVGLTMILPSWASGLGWIFVAFGLVNFLSVERLSRPPRNNLSAFQRRWKRRHSTSLRQNQTSSTQSPPILACVGASIIHGATSANFVNRVRPILFKALLGMNSSLGRDDPLSDPLWVVNLGQNSLCSWTVYHERLATVLSCHADFILILLGTNDVRAMFKTSYSKVYEDMWNLPTPPNWEDYRTNLEGIVQCLKEKSSSSNLQIGLCTLPPMGEDLQHPANDLVRKANAMIHDIAQKHACTVIPVFEALEEVIRHKQQVQPATNTPPPEEFSSLAVWMGPLHYFGCSWNWLSHLVGHHVLTDTLHLNDDTGELVANLVVQWLVKSNIQERLKTMAPKQS